MDPSAQAAIGVIMAIVSAVIWARGALATHSEKLATLRRDMDRETKERRLWVNQQRDDLGELRREHRVDHKAVRHDLNNAAGSAKMAHSEIRRVQSALKDRHPSGEWTG